MQAPILPGGALRHGLPSPSSPSASRAIQRRSGATVLGRTRGARGRAVHRLLPRRTWAGPASPRALRPCPRPRAGPTRRAARPGLRRARRLLGDRRRDVVHGRRGRPARGDPRPRRRRRRVLERGHVAAACFSRRSRWRVRAERVPPAAQPDGRLREHVFVRPTAVLVGLETPGSPEAGEILPGGRHSLSAFGGAATMVVSAGLGDAAHAHGGCTPSTYVHPEESKKNPIACTRPSPAAPPPPVHRLHERPPKFKMPTTTRGRGAVRPARSIAGLVARSARHVWRWAPASSVSRPQEVRCRITRRTLSRWAHSARWETAVPIRLRSRGAAATQVRPSAFSISAASTAAGIAGPQTRFKFIGAPAQAQRARLQRSTPAQLGRKRAAPRPLKHRTAF